MGTRVRKLAKELGGTPGELLGLLHALGQDRYRSSEDMLGDAIVQQVRRAWGRGERGTPVVMPEPEPIKAAPKAPADLMSTLVPGVVPTGGKPKRPKKLPSPDSPLEAIAAPSPEEKSLASLKRDLERSVARDRATLDDDRKGIEAERAGIAALRAELDAARAELAAGKAAIEAGRQELAAAREAFAAEQAADAARARPLLADLLAERGLKGADEYERAIQGLIATRRLRELLPYLEIGDRPAARAVLKRAIVLVGGEVPEGLGAGVAGIQVAPERAEMPGWGDLRRELARVAEALMLHGLRHVVLVGVPPAWQRMIRDAFDPRLEIRFTGGTDEGNGDRRVDAVIHADGEGARADLSERPIVVRVKAPDLVGFARAVREALAG